MPLFSTTTTVIIKKKSRLNSAQKLSNKPDFRLTFLFFYIVLKQDMVSRLANAVIFNDDHSNNKIKIPIIIQQRNYQINLTFD